MDKVDYKIFSTIARMSQKSLLKSMKTFLKKYYPSNKVKTTQDYILCEGEIPVMLVAHLDTVFKSPPKKIYYDREESVLWSPQGLGADDRAGVFAIMKIVQRGYRPHICFTTDEECGGVGAKFLVKHYKKAPFDLKYIIELDRQGLDDCVFYSCGNINFQDYIEKFGFNTEWGSFSDISIICPVWEIAGVNLSVGYFNEHNLIETLNTKFLHLTINKVCNMLGQIEEASYFEYVSLYHDPYWRRMYQYYMNPAYEEEAFDYYSRYGWCDSKTFTCDKCQQVFLEDDILPAIGKNGEKKYFCINCVGTAVNWCDVCGEPFEADNDKENLCPKCKKEILKKNEL